MSDTKSPGPDRKAPQPTPVRTRVVDATPGSTPATGGSGGDPLLGAMVGNYEIVALIGQGGFGTVYKGHDVRLDRDAALKFLRNPLDAQHRRLFEREARAIAAVSKHPFIVEIYGWGEYGGQHYLILEFVGSSAEMLLRQNPHGLPVAKAVPIVAESADAVGYAHQHGILHRDIKPGNVLIEVENGRAKVADFGLARFTGSPDITASGVVSGSPPYMSPEQTRGKRVDGRSDVFALGVTLYQLLCGRRPFEGDTPLDIIERIRADERTPLRQRRPELPEAVLAAVEKATAHEPERRFQTGDELAAALRVASAPMERVADLPTRPMTVRLGREKKKPAQRTVCSACQTALASAHSVKGGCSVCGAPICYKCWALGERTCATHAAPVQKESAEGPASQRVPRTFFTKTKKPSVTCANCGKELTGLSFYPTGTVYCDACKQDLTQIPETLPEGAVRFEEARYLEILFHRFVEDAVRELATWPGDEELRQCNLVQAHEDPMAPLPEDFLASHPLGDELEKRLDRMPGNRCATIQVEYKAGAMWAREKRRVEVTLLCCTPLERLLEQGYVATANGAQELTAVVDRFRSTPGENRLVFAFSPTGWADNDTLPIPDGMVLVAPGPKGAWQTRQNVRDEALRGFVEALFDVETSGEKVEACIDLILAEPATRLPLSAQRLAKGHGLPLEVVAEAFRVLARDSDRYVACEDVRKDDWILDMQ